MYVYNTHVITWSHVLFTRNIRKTREKTSEKTLNENLFADSRA